MQKHQYATSACISSLVTYIRGLLLYNGMYFSVMIEFICVLLELGQNASLLEITFRSLLKYSVLYNRDYCSLDFMISFVADFNFYGTIIKTSSVVLFIFGYYIEIKQKTYLLLMI